MLLSKKNVRRLVSELKSDPLLELEAENAELRRLHAELEASRNHVRWLNQQLELRMGECSEQLQAILDSTMVGILSVDARGNIELMSATAERMFGYGPKELWGARLSTLMPAPFCDQPDGHLAWLLDAKAVDGAQSGNGLCHIHDLQGRRKDDSTFPLRLSVTERNLPSGRRFSLVILDLTKKRRLEGDLRHSQKLQLVGRLTSTIAHDFNNLLMGVSGCIDVAKSKLEPTHPAHRFLEEAKRSMASGTSITRPLLLFVRQQEARLINLEIDLAIERDKEMVRRLLHTGSELVLQLAAPGAKVTCPEGSVDQILLNLVAYLRDATPHLGQLTIASELVTLSERSGRLHLLLRPGPYVAVRVKSRFLPGTAETEPSASTSPPLRPIREAGKGTGLSLATAYSIIKQCNGHIEVRSGKESGLLFTVYLPIAQALLEESEERARTGPFLAPGCTVLLAEEDLVVRLDLRQALERMGYNVFEAGDAAEAMRLSRQPHQRLDLLLTNVALPDATGAQLAEELAAHKPELAVVYLSDSRVDALEGEVPLEPGMISLKKPVTSAALQAAIDLALGASSSPIHKGPAR